MEVVNAGANRRLEGADDVAELVGRLQGAADATRVRLGGDSFSVAACAAVAAALGGLKALRVVDLSDMFVSRLVDEIKDALDHLCVPLLALDGLESLDVGNNALGPRAALNLVGVLSKPTLRELYLNNTGLGTAGAEIVSKALRDGKVPLTKLVVGRNRLEDGGAVFIAQAVETMTTLEVLRAPSNSIQPPGTKALVLAAEKNCGSLRILDLGDNNLKGEARDALLQVLPKLTKLEQLFLGDSMIGPSAVGTVIDLIGSTLTELTTLDLSYCELEDEHADALLAALASRKDRIQKLELNGNIFTKATLKKIRAFVPSEDALGSFSDNEDDDDEDDDDDDDDDDVNALAAGVEKM